MIVPFLMAILFASKPYTFLLNVSTSVTTRSRETPGSVERATTPLGALFTSCRRAVGEA